jgi:hypothetical protein
MAVINKQPINFDPNSLQPAGQPSRMPYGVQSGAAQDDPASAEQIISTPMVDANGTPYVKIEHFNPATGQTTPKGYATNQGKLIISQDPNGQWTIGNKKSNSFLGGLVDTVLGDEKLMAFLAVAGGVGAYAAASGAAGGAGGAMLGGGTGATPGIVPGGTMGVEGIAGAGAASGALPGASSGPQWTGEGDTIPPGSNVPGGPPVTPPGGGNNLGGIGDWLRNIGANIPEWLPGLIGGIGDNYIANRQQQEQQRIAREYADKINSVAQQAADMSKFTPYNISGGLSTVRSDGKGGVTATLDPRLKAIQDQALGTAGGFLGSVNAGTPEQLAQQAYANYNAWAKPAQDQQFASLQDRLARQGLIGLSVNTQALPQTTPGIGIQGGTAEDFAPGGRFGGQPQTIGVNPYYKDFAQGVALADLKNYENAMRFGQDITQGQLDLGKGFLGVGVGLDDINREYLNQSGRFGEAQMRAGQIGGSFLVNGATDAARVIAGQANDASKADAERNRALWDSVFRNIF